MSDVKIYDITIDQMREITQIDVDQLQQGCLRLATKNRIVKAVADLNIIQDAELLSQLASLLKV